MATQDLENEVKDLKEKNNELVQKVQYWKMTAAERDNEKLALMKENNELRLKLSTIRNNGGIHARKLDESLQRSSEKAISLLIEASEEIAKSRELAKEYMRDRQKLDAQCPRWSTLGGTPLSENKDKVHRVRPMILGGKSIQPVVSLSRTLMNTGNPRPSPNLSLTDRAVPVRMLLQDVYIPLTRIDVADLPNNGMADTDNDHDNSTEDLGLDDSTERLDDESGPPLEDEEDYQGRQLDAVSEEEMEEPPTPPPPIRHRIADNPLEGPSWLLDRRTDTKRATTSGNSSLKLEPDSTTELEQSALLTPNTPRVTAQDSPETDVTPARTPREFSPTVRRRKRTSSPAASPRHHYSPRPASSRRSSISNRVLKVMVAKMRLDDSESPLRVQRRDLLTSFDAPSPNGATDSAVIVCEARNASLEREPAIEPNTSRNTSRASNHGAKRMRLASQDTRRTSQEQELSRTEEQRNRLTGSLSRSTGASRCGSADSRHSDGASAELGEGRVRRNRKMVTYKEKPLNRKLRR